MAFEPIEFLNLARGLATDRDSEAALRTAVGRAYYATFLQARERLRVRERRGVHKAVITALRRADREAGDHLDKFQELRNVADYELVVGDPLHSNWIDNWNKADNFATAILRRIEGIR